MSKKRKPNNMHARLERFSRSVLRQYRVAMPNAVAWWRQRRKSAACAHLATPLSRKIPQESGTKLVQPFGWPSRPSGQSQSLAKFPIPRCIKHLSVYIRTYGRRSAYHRPGGFRDSR